MPRDRKTSRLPEDAGTVYRYDAMAAGLTLQAMIFTEANDEQVEKLIALLKDATFWIGRARRAGYGEVRITVVEDDGQRENGSYNRPEATEHLPLMLTSDALLRDEWGQATLDPCAAVAAALGLPPSDFKVLDSAFLTAKVVGGFNRKWGLPLPQTLALAAGSTFDLETNAPLSTEQLEQLEQQGIGERRNEGFGQVLVRADEKEKINSERAQFQFTPAKLNLSEIESKLAQTLAERLLRRKLDDELRQLINRIELENTPLKHQIARLRVLLRELERGRQPHKKIEDEQLERLANYLQDVEGRRAGAQLAHAQIDEKPQAGATLKATLSVWIKAQLLPGSEELADDKYQTVVEAAQKRWSGLEVSLGAGVTATVDAATSQEYSLRLINQVLQRAAKLARAKEKERQDG